MKATQGMATLAKNGLLWSWSWSWVWLWLFGAVWCCLMLLDAQTGPMYNSTLVQIN